MPGIACPKCHTPAPTPALPGPVALACAMCGTRWQARAFPRLLSPIHAAPSPGGKAEEGNAVCAFFPHLKAETVCDECGCLLSHRAAVRRDDTTLCLPCLHQVREARDLPAWRARRILPDHLALSLVTWLAPLGFFTAPLALYFLIRHRSDSRGLVPRGAGRWWVALGLSLLWVLLWGTLLALFILLMVRAFRQS